MRTLLVALALLAPLAHAGSDQAEDYVAAGGGPASWASACLQDVNVGAACFPLEGWERMGYVELDDAFAYFAAAHWFALDEDLLPVTGGALCHAPAEIPPGAAYFVVDFNPTSGLSPIPECQPAVAGTAHVWLI